MVLSSGSEAEQLLAHRDGAVRQRLLLRLRSDDPDSDKQASLVGVNDAASRVAQRQQQRRAKQAPEPSGSRGKLSTQTGPDGADLDAVQRLIAPALNMLVQNKFLPYQSAPALLQFLIEANAPSHVCAAFQAHDAGTKRLLHLLGGSPGPTQTCAHSLVRAVNLTSTLLAWCARHAAELESTGQVDLAAFKGVGSLTPSSIDDVVALVQSAAVLAPLADRHSDAPNALGAIMNALHRWPSDKPRRLPISLLAPIVGLLEGKPSTASGASPDWFLRFLHFVAVHVAADLDRQQCDQETRVRASAGELELAPEQAQLVQLQGSFFSALQDLFFGATCARARATTARILQAMPSGTLPKILVQQLGFHLQSPSNSREHRQAFIQASALYLRPSAAAEALLVLMEKAIHEASSAEFDEHWLAWVLALGDLVASTEHVTDTVYDVLSDAVLHELVLTVERHDSHATLDAYLAAQPADAIATPLYQLLSKARLVSAGKVQAASQVLEESNDRPPSSACSHSSEHLVTRHGYDAQGHPRATVLQRFATALEDQLVARILRATDAEARCNGLLLLQPFAPELSQYGSNLKVSTHVFAQPRSLVSIEWMTLTLELATWVSSLHGCCYYQAVLGVFVEDEASNVAAAAMDCLRLLGIWHPSILARVLAFAYSSNATLREAARKYVLSFQSVHIATAGAEADVRPAIVTLALEELAGVAVEGQLRLAAPRPADACEVTTLALEVLDAVTGWQVERGCMHDAFQVMGAVEAFVGKRAKFAPVAAQTRAWTMLTNNRQLTPDFLQWIMGHVRSSRAALEGAQTDGLLAGLGSGQIDRDALVQAVCGLELLGPQDFEVVVAFAAANPAAAPYFAGPVCRYLAQAPQHQRGSAGERLQGSKTGGALPLLTKVMLTPETDVEAQRALQGVLAAPGREQAMVQQELASKADPLGATKDDSGEMDPSAFTVAPEFEQMAMPQLPQTGKASRDAFLSLERQVDRLTQTLAECQEQLRLAREQAEGLDGELVTAQEQNLFLQERCNLLEQKGAQQRMAFEAKLRRTCDQLGVGVEDGNGRSVEAWSAPGHDDASTAQLEQKLQQHAEQLRQQREQELVALFGQMDPARLRQTENWSVSGYGVEAVDGEDMTVDLADLPVAERVKLLEMRVKREEESLQRARALTVQMKQQRQQRRVPSQAEGKDAAAGRDGGSRIAVRARLTDVASLRALMAPVTQAVTMLRSLANEVDASEPHEGVQRVFQYLLAHSLRGATGFVEQLAAAGTGGASDATMGGGDFRLPTLDEATGQSLGRCAQLLSMAGDYGLQSWGRRELSADTRGTLESLGLSALPTAGMLAQRGGEVFEAILHRAQALQQLYPTSRVSADLETVRVAMARAAELDPVLAPRLRRTAELVFDRLAHLWPSAAFMPGLHLRSFRCSMLVPKSKGVGATPAPGDDSDSSASEPEHEVGAKDTSLPARPGAGTGGGPSAPRKGRAALRRQLPVFDVQAKTAVATVALPAKVYCFERCLVLVRRHGAGRKLEACLEWPVLTLEQLHGNLPFALLKAPAPGAGVITIRFKQTLDVTQLLDLAVSRRQAALAACD
ncbi:uncharacterized protein MONBRDRAFT_9840 [Monosiga brevicollis MX1]|uniref:Uncharacterized protein n=1 Tax=Monosiga brevicollis TaxID=81824 RepID=A9V4E0_MONBE|nr:uncharacterized protein MONBRDRAFT_9840 [Monosiga brevicollis MX1]EDQ87693.1 predicted protein [Monosiga brevicollis MX1]|eukprot:XP_001747613.1 hypothetical protein [Monosiga brevicollis MX1]